MRIGICDDEKVIVEKIKRAILSHKLEYNTNVEIDGYYSGTDLLEAIQKGEKYDLIFLDIEMTGLDGLAVGEQIRTVMDDIKTQIIIVSGNSHYAMVAYKIMPMKFIQKPFEEIDIVEGVKMAMKILGNQKRFFAYKVNRDIYTVPTEEIYYFEVYRKTIRVVCKNKEIQFYKTLNEIEARLKEYGFVRISKSQIVNGMYITSVEGNELTINTKTKLNIGKEYKLALMEFLCD